MPRETRETTIDGVTYKVTQVGAKTGGMFIFRVGRVLAGLLDGADGFVQALQHLPPEEFSWATGVLVGSTAISVTDTAAGADAKTRTVPLEQLYDDHFAGNYQAWRQWLTFAAEANFGSFFADALARFRAMRAPSTSSSPKAPTGSAGDSSSPSA